MIGLIMFLVTLILLMVGFPVAFTFAGMAVIFGVLTQGVDLFAFAAKYDFNGSAFVYFHGYCLAKNQTRRAAFRSHG